MKNFFTSLLGAFIGVFTSMIFMFVIFVVFVSALISSNINIYNTPNISSKSVLHLSLKNIVEETDKSDELYSYFGVDDKTSALKEVIRAINKAKKSESIIGIFIDDSDIQVGYATISEIREALSNFKSSGKFIYSYGGNYSQKDYYLSALSDSIFLNPVGSVNITGLSSQTMFYKNFLDKLGVEMQVLRVGEYKSAVEPYINTKMSDASRIQTSAYLSQIWNSISTDIAKDRHLETNSINALADTLLMAMESKYLLDNHIIDKIAYKDEVLNTIKIKCNADNINDIPFVSISEVNSIKSVNNNSENTLAVLVAEGDIDGGDGVGINSAEIIPVINDLALDDNVKVMLLRVNSPGGSAYGSEQIWHALENFKSKGKKLVVSMGDVAASGGYYISCGADAIFADANTITGSIGIFGIIPNMQKLLEDKIGLTADDVKTNKYGTLSVTKPLSPGEYSQMQRMIERGYATFVDRCSKGRHVSVDSIKAIAGGRVWDGRSALKIGLIDSIGSMNNAIKYAVNVFGKEDYTVRWYNGKHESLLSLLKNIETSVSNKYLKSRFGTYYQYIKGIEYINSQSNIQCKMEDVFIN